MAIAMRIEKADAIVVGSGFGGAVTAARLAEAGLKVLVLERGPWWTSSRTNGASNARPVPRGIWGARKLIRGIHWARGSRGRSIVLNKDGLLELHVFDQLQAVTGSGVGGGSLIYGDVQTQPDDPYFAHFPPEITADELRPYYDRVRDVMRPSPFPKMAPRSTILERFGATTDNPATHAELAVSWRSGFAGDPQRSTSYLFGSEHEGKRSLDKTYLPLALRSGATVRSLCEVIAFERNGGLYKVYWKDHNRSGRGCAEAPRLIIAAGTLGTLRLLFAARDRDATLQVPASLGAHFSTGADMAASLLQCQGADDSEYGPCPGVGLAFADRGQHCFLILESALPFDSLPLPPFLLKRMRPSIGLASMGRDSSAGKVWFDGKELHTHSSRADDAALFSRMESEIERIVAAYRPKKVTFDHGEKAQLTTVHPLGGVTIASSPDAGVVDHRGEVFGNPGLYVADGSLLPRAPGWPPSMTIAALAERQAALMIAAAH